MIVKSISKKGVCFGKLLKYISEPEKVGNSEVEEGRVLHNFREQNTDISSLEREFLDNHRYNQSRKNGVTCYHEILSLAEGSSHSKEMIPILEDLGQTYLQYRAPRALALGQVHMDTDHPHIHLLISGNEIETSKKVRITKRRFEEVKQKLEHYQERHYPILSHSVVFGPKKGEKRLTNAQTYVRDQVIQHLDAAGSEKAFIENLDQAGIEIYQRGKGLGVLVRQTGRKYRFKTLRLQDDFTIRKQQWAQAKEQDQDFFTIQEVKARSRQLGRSRER
jgi:hypothetical protein